MEHIDNDMDDLFQKAGELYPLKTTGSDWDAVAGKLQDESFGDTNTLSGLTARGNRNKRRWLLLLLLVPLGLGIAYTSGLLNQKNNTSLVVKPSALGNQPTSEVKIPDAAYNNNDKSEKTAINKETGESNKKLTPAKSSSASENISKPGSSTTNGRTQIYAGRINKMTAENTGNGQSKMIPKSNAAKNSLNSKNGMKGLVSTEAAGINKPAEKLSNPGNQDQKTQTLAVPPPTPVQNETAADKKNSNPEENVKSGSADSSSKLKTTDTKTKANKGFYIGFVVGPDISSVDFQSIKQPGFSLGVTAGYRFSKKISLETGFLFDRKYYYSDGTHYKNQQPGYTIVNVNGNCNMLEIPLLLRYDFASGSNHGFFAKAGFSSYLMTKQNYSANSEYNGMPPQQFDWTNSKDKGYFLSVAQLSGGYEFSISGKTKIQIEPYIKIPLQGIGQGSMPISSAGIYFGITHSFR
jgi:Outer membrane protein beta-barrel domain